MKETKEGLVEGVRVSGEYLKGLEKKTFEIVDVPQYIELPNIKHPEKIDRKLSMHVLLADGITLEYLPNRTSIKMLTRACGLQLINWKGYTGEFQLAEQIFDGKLVSVVYVKEATK